MLVCLQALLEGAHIKKAQTIKRMSLDRQQTFPSELIEDELEACAGQAEAAADAFAADDSKDGFSRCDGAESDGDSRPQEPAADDPIKPIESDKDGLPADTSKKHLYREHHSVEHVRSRVRFDSEGLPLSSEPSDESLARMSQLVRESAQLATHRHTPSGASSVQQSASPTSCQAHPDRSQSRQDDAPGRAQPASGEASTSASTQPVSLTHANSSSREDGGILDLPLRPFEKAAGRLLQRTKTGLLVGSREDPANPSNPRDFRRGGTGANLHDYDEDVHGKVTGLGGLWTLWGTWI